MPKQIQSTYEITVKIDFSWSFFFLTFKSNLSFIFKSAKKNKFLFVSDQRLIKYLLREKQSKELNFD